MEQINSETSDFDPKIWFWQLNYIKFASQL